MKAPNINDCNPLIAATMQSDSKLVKQALQAGVDVNEQDFFKKTALMHAAAQGDIEIITLLLQAGADIDVQNYIGMTALMTAIYEQKQDAVKMLVHKGAALDIKNEHTLTPLMLAVQFWVKKDKEIVRILLEAGANINAIDCLGYSVLTHATIFGHDEIVELLLKHGAAINPEEDWYGTVVDNYIKIVELLLQHGVKVNQKNRSGKTALEYAIKHKHNAMIELLKQHGAV